MSKRFIRVEASINITAAVPAVFEYISNYCNDSVWREEIKEVNIDSSKIVEGTNIIEESFLSKRVPKHITILQCTHLNKNKMIEAETTGESLFWQKNSRQTITLSGTVTKMHYKIQFDPSIVKYGLGFNLPKFIVSFYTKMTMKKYLEKLKSTIEAKN